MDFLFTLFPYPELPLPDNLVHKHREEVQASIDNFKNHQGEVIGNQVVEQSKAVYHLGKDAVSGVKDIINSKK